MNIHNLGLNDSLLNQYMAEVRDTGIQNDRMRFRRNVERIGEIMAYEISKTLKYQMVDIQTPLGLQPVSVPSESIVLATILRAGLPFHQGFLSYFDKADNAFVSALRKYNDDHSAFTIESGYLSSPSIAGKTLILIDPMLATGRSLDLAYQLLLKNGEPARIHLACVIASRQGVEATSRLFPEDITTIWAGAIDPDLNDKAYIVPGLGDAGDLAYGEKI
jgi:uracil phosphoribosyltransferase